VFHIRLTCACFSPFFGSRRLPREGRVPAGGIPARGLPSAAAGLPTAAGLPAAGIPTSAGVPAAGLPAAALRAAAAAAAAAAEQRALLHGGMVRIRRLPPSQSPLSHARPAQLGRSPTCSTIRVRRLETPVETFAGDGASDPPAALAGGELIVWRRRRRMLGRSWPAPIGERLGGTWTWWRARLPRAREVS
jgi:hypothetical protein